MQAEYAKITPSHHSRSATVPSNNLQLCSCMTLLGGRCFLNPPGEGENLIQIACFLVKCLNLCGCYLPHQLQLERKQLQLFCEVLSAYQTLEVPGRATLSFWIFIRLRQEISISWGWGSPGHALKQNLKSLEKLKIKQGGSNRSQQPLGLDTIEWGYEGIFFGLVISDLPESCLGPLLHPMTRFCCRLNCAEYLHNVTVRRHRFLWFACNSVLTKKKKNSGKNPHKIYIF